MNVIIYNTILNQIPDREIIYCRQKSWVVMCCHPYRQTMRNAKTSSSVMTYIPLHKHFSFLLLGSPSCKHISIGSSILIIFPVYDFHHDHKWMRIVVHTMAFCMKKRNECGPNPWIKFVFPHRVYRKRLVHNNYELKLWNFSILLPISSEWVHGCHACWNVPFAWCLELNAFDALSKIFQYHISHTSCHGS